MAELVMTARSAGTAAIVEPPADPAEAQHVARAKAGDESAFVWLLERYRTRAVRLAAHVLRRDADAEDVAQDAFIQAFREIRRLRGERFRPWLYRIIVRLCLNRTRRASWKAESSLDDQTPHQSTDPRMSDAVTERIVVEMLLDRLSPPMRAVLVLRELDCLDYNEIAVVLGIPVGTVRSRLNAARATFRALWEEAGRGA
jgi:RNA polymerase sigma-70 factor, ECF subfamily